MPVVTIRLADEVVQEIDFYAQDLNISRNEYIKKAIEKANKEIKDSVKKKKLIEASRKIYAYKT
jgi:metal-responsive CopG/Arc/MetJ family transcriptional regulator